MTETAFEEFYETHHDRLVATLHGSVADLDLCVSAVDEAMARAFARWARVGRFPEPAGWVFVTARNVARKQLKRRQRHRSLSLDERPGAADGVVAADPPAGEVWSIVARLPERQREAVGLRHLLGLTERGVGEAMGITRGTVSSTLRDAYSTLGLELRDEPPPERVAGRRDVRRATHHTRRKGAET